MKKFFALALAVAMIMSMAAVSFAATNTVKLYGPWDYDADTNKVRTTGIQYGDSIYYLLTETAYDYEDEKGNTVDVPAVAMSKYEQVEKLKVKVAYEMGEDMVESVSIVKKYVENNGDYSKTTGKWTGVIANDEGWDLISKPGYYYFLAVKVAKSTSVSDVDIIGTFELNRKAKDDLREIDEEEFDFAANVAINNGWLKDSGKWTLTSDKADIKWDTDYALKFDNDDEIELSFGGTNDGNNEGTFTVDVSGQGKVYLRYNTKVDDAIAEANPGVKIFALNFNGVKFNRTGEFAYEMEDGVAAYKVVNGALVAIPGCEYDESDETFYFNTRVLENYVFASAELVNPVVEAPVVEAPAAPSNPSTGA